ncbi:MAG: alpha/beta fold hydrolase [Anaerolineales bacterium]|jgi:pimeloyl-ACP methyl ester carboxylesterase
MPYINNDGIKIHYQVEGDGPPVVLHHWSFGTLDDWYDYGYVDDLKKDYQLVILDARGHGKSDKPHDSESYRLEYRVSDVTAILDDLGIASAHFYGYSMGGWIGFGAAKYVPDRFRSLIIGGQHPYAQDLQLLRDIVRNGIDNGHEVFVETWERESWILTSEQRARLMQFDFGALMAVAQDRESLEDVLPTMTMPCMLIVGEKDSVYSLAKKCFPKIPNGEFVTIVGMDHFGGFKRSELALPHIRRFLSEHNQESASTLSRLQQDDISLE